MRKILFIFFISSMILLTSYFYINNKSAGISRYTQETTVITQYNYQDFQLAIEKIEINDENKVNQPVVSSEVEVGQRGSNDSKEINNTDQGKERTQKPLLIEQIKIHVVEKGESLWTISRKYDLDIDTLIGANEINNMNRIKPGMRLQILPIKGILYKISPGESLWSISRRFKISLNKIIEANNIANPDMVKPGKLLILPGAKPEFSYKDRLQRKFIKPVNARISSGYGMRWGRMHEGIDFAVNVGTNIVAAGAGKVIYSGWASGYGNTIIIEHRRGLRTLYAHNSRLLAHSGEWVERGEIIAKSGNTGRSTGPHLHFEIQINGRPVNPLNYLY